VDENIQVEEIWERYCDSVRASHTLQWFLRDCLSCNRTSVRYYTLTDGRSVEISVLGNGEVAILVAHDISVTPKMNRELGRKISRIFPADIIKLIKH